MGVAVVPNRSNRSASCWAAGIAGGGAAATGDEARELLGGAGRGGGGLGRGGFGTSGLATTGTAGSANGLSVCGGAGGWSVTDNRSPKSGVGLGECRSLMDTGLGALVAGIFCSKFVLVWSSWSANELISCCVACETGGTGRGGGPRPLLTGGPAAGATRSSSSLEYALIMPSSSRLLFVCGPR